VVSSEAFTGPPTAYNTRLVLSSPS
jgi:hypothetical protein